MYKKYHTPKETLRFRVGSAATCLYCGEKIINGDDSMMCSDCECKYGTSDSECYRTCDCCGTRVYCEEGYWVGDDDFVCRHCFNKEVFQCQECGDYHYLSNQHWDEENEQYVCDYCFNELGG